MTTLDELLDKLEDLTEGHPLPMTHTHCRYCSAWLIIIENILEN